jgi:hypothetical protein
VLNNGVVHFKSTRLLDPNVGPETYVIPLDTPINMIVAYLNTTSALNYHGASNHFGFMMTFYSNGSSCTTDGAALQTIVSGPLISLPNGSLLYGYYDAVLDMAVYDVLVMD